MTQSNEIVRVKQKLHAFVSNYEDLVLSVGCTLEILYVLVALLSAIVFRTLFSLIFIGGTIVTFLGSVFLLKEYEAETGKRTAWLYGDY